MARASLGFFKPSCLLRTAGDASKLGVDDASAPSFAAAAGAAAFPAAAAATPPSPAAAAAGGAAFPAAAAATTTTTTTTTTGSWSESRVLPEFLGTSLCHPPCQDDVE